MGLDREVLGRVSPDPWFWGPGPVDVTSACPGRGGTGLWFAFHVVSCRVEKCVALSPLLL